MIHVLYHSHCFDGFGAHYAAWKKFGNNAQYHAVNYNQPVPDGVEDEVYILDFSYPRDVLETLRSRCKTLVVLDHHHTAKEALEGFPGATFDMDQSGAVLAWKYFHPGTSVPRVLQLIQDGDLWKFELPGTKALRAALPLLKFEVESLDLLAKDDTAGQVALSRFLEKGNSILQLEDVEILSRVPSKVRVVRLFGFKCGCINVDTLISRTGDAIVHSKELGCDMALMFGVHGPDKVALSFRASKETDVDVSVVARKFSGGGHKKAAGARCTLEELSQILDGCWPTE